MKAILSMTIVAILSVAIAGCWFYSRPDPAGCQKTSYGLGILWYSTKDCGVAADAGATPSPIATPAPPSAP